MLKACPAHYSSAFPTIAVRSLRTTAATATSRTTMAVVCNASSGNGSLTELDSYRPVVRKREVIEHIAVFQMKDGFSEEQEKDMLDNLYTLQYQLNGIVALSLGTVTSHNADGCTHALFTRFPSEDALKSYYDSPVRWKIANEYIIPYNNDLICVDYKTQVEDDIGPIFRRGDEFERGVEHLMLFQAKKEVPPTVVEECLHELSRVLGNKLGELVVQHTSGTNFSHLNKGYTHGMVTRFPSEEAKDICISHSYYIETLEQKIRPIADKILSLEYDIVPIGTTSL